jgi:hypothetical protein
VVPRELRDCWSRLDIRPGLGDRRWVNRFDDLASLDDAALRKLLDSAHPERRLWAVWELALRTASKSALAQLFHRTADEPSAGVRAVLINVLAGYGEIDILVALAKSDPSIEVRARAMQALVRLVPAGAAPIEVVISRFALDGAAVRVAVLAAIGPAAPQPLERLAEDALRDPDEETAVEAFEAALRIGTQASTERALHCLSHAAADDPRWHRLASALAPDRIAELLAGGPLRARAIRALPISRVAPLLDPIDASVLDAVMSHAHLSEAPAPLLARCIVAGGAYRYLELLERHLATASDAPMDTDLLIQLTRRCAERLAALERGEPPTREESPGHRWPARYHYGRVIERCSRWI